MKTITPDSKLFRHLLTGLLLVGSLSLKAAIVLPGPTWAGDADTTFQSYTFTTSSTTAAPENVTNPYGTPEMLVTVVPFIGVGTGYQDPSDPGKIYFQDGAWDLGPDGSILFDIPVAPPVGSGLGYIVDVFVNVIYEPTSFIYNVPDVLYTPASVASTTVNPSYTVDVDGFPWGLLTSETTIGSTPTELIQVLVDATGSNGSLIDTVEIHTRYQVIPEPESMALIMAGCTFVVLLIRRSRLNALRAS